MVVKLPYSKVKISSSVIQHVTRKRMHAEIHSLWMYSFAILTLLVCSTLQGCDRVTVPDLPPLILTDRDRMLKSLKELQHYGTDLFRVLLQHRDGEILLDILDTREPDKSTEAKQNVLSSLENREFKVQLDSLKELISNQNSKHNAIPHSKPFSEAFCRLFIQTPVPSDSPLLRGLYLGRDTERIKKQIPKQVQNDPKKASWGINLNFWSTKRRQMR